MRKGRVGMLEKLSGKKVLIITVIFVLFTSIVLPMVAHYSTVWIGVAESPDTGFGMSLVDYYSIRDNYGSEGRKIYTILRFTFDIVWPIVYGVFLFTSIFYLNKITNVFKKIKIHYIALLAVLFDFFENILAVIFMNTHPKEIDFLVYLLRTVSYIKWLFVGGSFVFIIVLFVIHIYREVFNHETI